VDLGAGGTLIKKASVSKAIMTFDESITLRNSDGEHVVPSSSRNTIEIAGLRWDDLPVAVADNMTRREDAIVGNTLFQDRILEIDYDRMVLVIHDTLPDLSLAARRHVLGVVPFVPHTLEAGGLQSGWFARLGANTSILRHQRLSTQRSAASFAVRAAGGTMRPVVSFGGHVLGDQLLSTGTRGLVGPGAANDVEAIVDNRLGAAGQAAHAPAPRNPEQLVVRSVIAVIVGAAFVVRRVR
jgi:hypothetical protein